MLIDASSLCGQLYEYRVTHGLTIKGMAKLIGTDPSTVTYWERGQGAPSKTNWKLLLPLLKI
jgi:DNA-binding transcriptional regulator YiaG